MKNQTFIITVIASAFLLRIVGVCDGLPAAYNSTEYTLSKIALSLGARQSLDPQLYIYPTLYEYFLFLQYAAVYIGGVATGAFKNTTDFALQFLIDPSVFYLTGRITNVLLSVLTVFIFYRQTRKIYSEITARFASAIAGVSFYFILFSRYAVADTLLILFSTLATLAILKAYYHPGRINYFWSGIFTGLAIGTKYNAGFLVFAIGLAFILNWKEQRHKNPWQNFLMVALAVPAGFLIFNPLWLIKFDDFLKGYQMISAQMSGAVSLYHGNNYIWEISQMIRHEFFIGLGFFAGTFYAMYKRKPSHFILLVPVMVTFLYVGSWQKKGIDYLFAVFPAWILLSSIWLEKVWYTLKYKHQVKILFLTVLFAPSILMGIYHNILALNTDTREQATDWMIKNVEKDEKIAYDHYTFDLGLFDVYRYTEYGAGSDQLPDRIKSAVEKYTTHPRNVSNIQVQFLSDHQEDSESNPYDSEQAQIVRKSLAELQKDGVDYFIANSWFYRPYLEAEVNNYTPVIKKRIENIRNFYNLLREEGDKIKSFEPDFWHPGPLIQVYDISQEE